MKNRDSRKAVVGVFLVVGLLASLAGCGKQAEAPKAAAPAGGARPPTPVEAQKVDVRTVYEETTATGTLLADESVTIKPEISGRISQIHFKEAQRVSKGDLLVSLDSSVYEAELAQIQADFNLSQREFARADDLFKRGSGSLSNRDEVFGRLESNKARLALAQARLAKTRIVAPFDGQLGLRDVSVGEYVNPGQNLVTLDRLDPMKVEFRAPEKYLASIRQGQSLTANMDAHPDVDFKGTVYAIDSRVDTNTRTFTVRANIANQEGKLKPGLYARVKLLLDERANAITVPEQAIMPKGDMHLVYKVVEGKAEAQAVKLGLRRQGWAEIVEGLNPDDIVITAGHLKIRPGAAVAPINNATDK